MNAKTFIAVAALALTATAGFASEAPQFKNEHSTLTRAEVRAELLRARAAGELGHGEGSESIQPKATVSVASRAEVIAELRRARAAGELGNGEGYDSLLASRFNQRNGQGAAPTHTQASQQAPARTIHYSADSSDA